MKPTDYTYLIIGGAPKCGTTSLFEYLATHPQVSAAHVKETSYFCSPEFQNRYTPLVLKRASQTRDLEPYLDLFPNAQRPVRLDGSVCLLYSFSEWERMQASGLRFKVIFILREPISRFVSGYQQSLRAYAIPSDMSIADYYHASKTGKKPFLGLRQGFYSRYLPDWYHALAPDDLLLLRYRDLQANAQALMERVCAFAGIDAGYYADYTFNLFNAHYEPRNVALHTAYMTNILKLRTVVIQRYPTLFHYLHEISIRWWDPLYTRLNQRPSTTKPSALPAELRQTLEAEYAGEADRLEALTGIRFF